MAIEIKLTQGKVAIIDEEDFDLVSQHKWHADKNHNTWYAKTNVPREGGGQRTIKMHRLILGLSDPETQVDHCDGDGLNNRRANLRSCTNAENMRNTGAKANNTSGYKGVSWFKRDGKWLAQIQVDGKKRHLGLYNTQKEAHQAYCKAAAELHGSFANTGAKPPKKWSKPTFEYVITGAPR